MCVRSTAFSLSIKVIIGSIFVNVQPSSHFQIKPRRVNTAHFVGLLVGGAELRATVAATRQDCRLGRARGSYRLESCLRAWPARPWVPGVPAVSDSPRENAPSVLRSMAQPSTSAATHFPQAHVRTFLMCVVLNHHYYFR